MQGSVLLGLYFFPVEHRDQQPWHSACCDRAKEPEFALILNSYTPQGQSVSLAGVWPPV